MRKTRRLDPQCRVRRFCDYENARRPAQVGTEGLRCQRHRHIPGSTLFRLSAVADREWSKSFVRDRLKLRMLKTGIDSECSVRDTQSVRWRIRLVEYLHQQYQGEWLVSLVMHGGAVKTRMASRNTRKDFLPCELLVFTCCRCASSN